MSGVALVAGTAGSASSAGSESASDLVGRMLAASPHRGSHTQTAQQQASRGAAVGVARHVARPDDGSIGSGAGWVCAFAGVLDNRSELARELELAPDATAAEVAATGYLRGGDGFVCRMRGVYGVVLAHGDEVVAWRDHIGLMPLFYRAQGGLVIVGTEAKQVVAGAGIPYEPDVDVCVAIIHEDQDDEMPAALRGVQRLRKGAVLHIAADGHTVIRPYWHPDRLVETARLTGSEIEERFHELMQQAVARAMRGDDVVLLSGGIDSPAVAAYGAVHSREKYGHPLLALSTVYPDFPAVDESEYIEAAASFFGTPLTTYTFDVPHLDNLQEWARVADGPVHTVILADAADAYRRAVRLGRSTVLTGDLAEFLIDQRQDLLAHYVVHGRFRSAAAEIGYFNRGRRRIRRPAMQVLSALTPHAAKSALRDRRDPAVRPMLAPWLDPALHRLPQVSQKSPIGRRWREGQYRFLEGPGLSLEADEVCQEVCGVRARHPWTDIDLWEFFLTLRAEDKFPSGVRKALVRRLLRGRVPDLILDRTTKVVFNDVVVGRMDYPALRQWLTSPTTRLPGVDYGVLRQRIEAGNLDIGEYMWAKDLASVHAFLGLWD